MQHLGNEGSLPPRFHAMMKRLSERREGPTRGSITALCAAQKCRFFTGNLPVQDGDDWNAGYYLRTPLREDTAKVRGDREGALGKLMLTNLLETPIEGRLGLDRLLQVLGYAMTARDVWATTKIWDKIATEALQVGLVSKDKWSIYAADAQWPDMDEYQLEFLALKVRRPRLLLVALESRMMHHNGGTVVADTEGERKPSGEMRRLRKAAAGIVAAILIELYHLPRCGVAYQDDRRMNQVLWQQDAKEREAEDRGLHDDQPPNADDGNEAILGGWKLAILALCRLVPNHPEWAGGLHVVWRLEEELFGRTQVTPLDMAVLCSERFPVALDVLGAVAWERSELTTAFQLAIHPGALRTPLMVEIAKALYARVVQPRAPPTQAQAYHRVPGNELVYCEVMWTAVYRAASFYAYTEVHGLSTSGIAVAMMQPNQGHPPEIYEDILRGMFEATVGTPVYANEVGDTFANVLRRVLVAMLVPSPNPTHAVKPDLASLLMQFLDEMNHLKSMVLDPRLAILRYPPQEERGNLLWLAAYLPAHHYSCLLDHLEAQMLTTDEVEAEELWEAGFAALVAMLATRGHTPRDNFDLLFALLAKRPDKLRTSLAAAPQGRTGPLDNYVRRFGAPHKTMQHHQHHLFNIDPLFQPREVREMVARKLKEDLEKFLSAGEWSQEHLSSALRVASNTGATTAVQVLISPPWNAPMIENDGFVRAIFDAVFAPGEPVVQSTGIAFADRQSAA